MFLSHFGLRERSKEEFSPLYFAEVLGQADLLTQTLLCCISGLFGLYVGISKWKAIYTLCRLDCIEASVSLGFLRSTLDFMTEKWHTQTI